MDGKKEESSPSRPVFRLHPMAVCESVLVCWALVCKDVDVRIGYCCSYTTYSNIIYRRRTCGPKLKAIQSCHGFYVSTIAVHCDVAMMLHSALTHHGMTQRSEALFVCCRAGSFWVFCWAQHQPSHRHTRVPVNFPWISPSARHYLEGKFGCQLSVSNDTKPSSSSCLLLQQSARKPQELW